jgi:hypothetical protein
MNLYEVIFYDQPDVIFLVRARSFKEALDEVELNGRSREWGDKSHLVYEIGKDAVEARFERAQILRGPYRQAAYNQGWKVWHRKTVGFDYVNEWGEGDGISDQAGPK